MKDIDVNIRPILLLLIAALLTGCAGFQLRGSEPLPASISPVLVTGINQYSDLYRQLEYQLSASGIRVTSSKDDAATVLKLNQVKSSDKLTAINSKGKGVEYLLAESANMSLYDRTGATLVSERKVAVDHYRYALDTKQLSSERAREEKEREMQQLLAQKIMRTIHYAMRTGSN
ncbi:rare lipoprotein B [Solemya velum gill symbiont]|uniref:LPS-assembly lipoprotein LptE n=1 Tax=Solemya velum gill symbiont TaxID=2340 RepID=A0A0B0H912_SOVGS|nr:rare lipoprotein B [Solemya velum gill symbiont]